VEITPVMVWLILTVVPAINNMFLIVASLFAAGVIVYGVVYMVEDKVTAEAKKRLKRSIVLFLMFMSLYNLFPTRDVVIATIVVPVIANSEIVDTLPADLMTLYNIGVDKLMLELAPGSEK